MLFRSKLALLGASGAGKSTLLRALLGAGPLTRGTVREGAVVRVAAAGAATMTEVVRRLDAGHLEPTGLQLRQPSLDDVFLALTGRSAEETPTEDTSRRGRRRKGEAAA